jgi:hypothetical protein
LPANFAEHGGLPVAIIVIRNGRRGHKANSPTEWAGHTKSAIHEKRRQQIVRRFRFPPQRADQTQSGNCVASPRHGPPSTFGTGKLE